MDALTHAAVGAATGYAFGGVILAGVGAVVAVLPDLPIWVGKRRATPPQGYIAAHSGLAIVAVLLLAVFQFYFRGALWETCATISLAWVSHIVLDLPTHCKTWQPKLLYPFSNRVLFAKAREWEWFDETWFMGFAIALTWIWICLDQLK